jgi:hypothetical protein
MKQYNLTAVFSISLAALLAGAALAQADGAVASVSGDGVPITEEPVYSDAIVTGNSNANRSPAGWFSESDDDSGDADSAVVF